MTDVLRWQSTNDEYMSIALTWLRLRFSQRVDISSPLPVGAGSRGTGRSSNAAIQENVAEPTIDELAQEMARLEAIDPPPALIILSQRLGLSRFEQHILLLCAGMELDTRIAALCAQFHDNPARAYPTFALALALFDDPAWEALSPERPLRYWRLLEITQPGVQPLTTSPLRLDERILNYLKGLNYLDDRLTPMLVPFKVTIGQTELPPSQQAVVGTILRRIKQTPKNQRPPVVQLLGTDTASKQLIAQRVAIELGLRIYCAPIELLPSHANELEMLVRLWQRESILLPISLYLDAYESVTEATPDPRTSPFSRFLLHSGGLFFLDSLEVKSNLGRDTFSHDVARPTTGEQEDVWTAALGRELGNIPEILAGQFNLSVPSIQQICLNVRDEQFLERRLDDESIEQLGQRLWNACLLNTRPRLDALAQRINTKATWDDIVLPDTELHLLHRIVEQLKYRRIVYEDWGFARKLNRGLGVIALFGGESGTGKTMAAEVIANDLGLNLYRIDLSGVVSKYIGETEKNLRRLFDATEDGGTILFFDEADALFGKRGEVKDSHDRYANIEINYLLQRIEAYRGLAILATNMKGGLDKAFLRRLHFIVNFPLPGPAERKVIWHRAFPSETPTEGLDYERLAKLNFTGGSIQSVALGAAFLAAQASSPITMSLILEAAQAEFRKLDRLIDDSELAYIVKGSS